VPKISFGTRRIWQIIAWLSNEYVNLSASPHVARSSYQQNKSYILFLSVTQLTMYVRVLASFCLEHAVYLDQTHTVRTSIALVRARTAQRFRSTLLAVRITAARRFDSAASTAQWLSLAVAQFNACGTAIAGTAY